MKKILITAGGTREYIDDVRVLTNISSGKLGAKIAQTFLKSAMDAITSKWPIKDEYEVHYVFAKGSELPFPMDINDAQRETNWYSENAKYSSLFNYNPLHLYEVTDVASLMKVMEELVPQMDVVIHSMAVSDFGFKPISTKLKSSDPEAFIESMKERIYKTPKVLSHIKEWNPDCFLISFKFEVGLTLEQLYDAAIKSMVSNQCDVVVANDKKEMVDNKKHIAHIIRHISVLAAGEYELVKESGLLNNDENSYALVEILESKEEIANKLYEIVSAI